MIGFPVLLAWTGWTFLTPFPLALALSQLPLTIVVVGWLLTTTTRGHHLRAQPPSSIVVRPADAATLAAWRARTAGVRAA